MTKYSDYYYYTNQIIVSQNLQQRCDLKAALFFLSQTFKSTFIYYSTYFKMNYFFTPLIQSNSMN